MSKKEYYVFIPKENGGYKAVRFFKKDKAEKYKNKFKNAFVKEI